MYHESLCKPEVAATTDGNHPKGARDSGLLLAPTAPLSDVAHSLIPECHDERPRSLDEATK